MKEFTHYILEIVIIILLLVVFYLLKNYWPKYFEAKATNQATKEDIGEITQIVENIKSDLSQQIELLKAQLSLTNQHKLDIKSAEREAIFDFNKRKSVWIYSLIRFSFYKYDLDNFREINRLTYLEYQQRQYEYDLASAHLILFMHDKEFMQLKEKLIVQVLELHSIVLNTTYSLFEAFIKAEMRLNSEKDNSPEKSKIRYEMIEELLSIQNIYKGNTEKQFERVTELDYQMRELLCNRLKILEDSTTAYSGLAK